MGVQACIASPPRSVAALQECRAYDVADYACFDRGYESVSDLRASAAADHGLDPQLGEWLLALVDSGTSERQVVITFLMGLLIGPTGSCRARTEPRAPVAGSDLDTLDGSVGVAGRVAPGCLPRRRRCRRHVGWRVPAVRRVGPCGACGSSSSGVRLSVVPVLRRYLRLVGLPYGKALWDVLGEPRDSRAQCSRGASASWRSSGGSSPARRPSTSAK